MTQKEFQDRVKMQVSAGEYTAIEVVYMNSDLEKRRVLQDVGKDECKAHRRISQGRKGKTRETRAHIASRFHKGVA